MINPVHYFEEVTQPVLHDMSRVFGGANQRTALNLSIGTTWQESLGGTYLRQLSGGPGRGVNQIEPFTHEDTWLTYLVDQSPARQNYIRDLVPARYQADLADGDYQALEPLLVYDLRYQTVFQRLKYYRISFWRFYELEGPAAWSWPDPNDIPAIGKLWDDIYNANDEHGTVDEFVANFPYEILDI